jgi:hypothetical protein
MLPEDTKGIIVLLHVAISPHDVVIQNTPFVAVDTFIGVRVQRSLGW